MSHPRPVGSPVVQRATIAGRGTFLENADISTGSEKSQWRDRPAGHADASRQGHGWATAGADGWSPMTYPRTARRPQPKPRAPARACAVRCATRQISAVPAVMKQQSALLAIPEEWILPCAAQLPDGSIDTEAKVTTDPPHVTIYE